MFWVLHFMNTFIERVQTTDYKQGDANNKSVYVSDATITKLEFLIRFSLGTFAANKEQDLVQRIRNLVNCFRQH